MNQLRTKGKGQGSKGHRGCHSTQGSQPQGGREVSVKCHRRCRGVRPRRHAPRAAYLLRRHSESKRQRHVAGAGVGCSAGVQEGQAAQAHRISDPRPNSRQHSAPAMRLEPCTRAEPPSSAYGRTIRTHTSQDAATVGTDEVDEGVWRFGMHPMATRHGGKLGGREESDCCCVLLGCPQIGRALARDKVSRQRGRCGRSETQG